MTNKAKMKKLLVEDQVPPCFNCRYATLCRKNQLACGLFKHYCVQPGSGTVPLEYRNKRPARKWYNDLFTDLVDYSETRHGT